MGTSFTVAACTRTSSITASADPTIMTFFPTLHSASGTSSSSRDRPRGGRTPISFCRFGCTPVRACSARFSAPTLASAPASSTTSSAPHFTRRLRGPGPPPPPLPLPDASAIGAAGEEKPTAPLPSPGPLRLALRPPATQVSAGV